MEIDPNQAGALVSQGERVRRRILGIPVGVEEIPKKSIRLKYSQNVHLLNKCTFCQVNDLI